MLQALKDVVIMRWQQKLPIGLLLTSTFRPNTLTPQWQMPWIKKLLFTKHISPQEKPCSFIIWNPAKSTRWAAGLTKQLLQELLNKGFIDKNMIRNLVKSVFIVLAIGALFSCENNIKVVKNINAEDTLAELTATDIHYIRTDSGRRQLVLNSPLQIGRASCRERV